MHCDAPHASPLRPARTLIGAALPLLLAGLTQSHAAELNMQTGNANLFSLAAANACNTAVLVGSHGSVLVSEDSGRHWRNAGLNLGSTLQVVSASQQAPSYLAVGVRGSLAYSTDCGKTWAAGSVHDSAGFRSLITADQAGNILLAGGDKGVLLRSINEGQTWEERKLGQAHLAQLLRTSAGSVLAGGEQGLLAVSRDAGLHWTPIAGLDSAALTRLQEVMPGLLLASFADGRLVYSGATATRWQASRLPESDKPAVINAFAANRQGVILAASADGRLLRSTDRAKSWQWQTGIPGRFLSAIVVTQDDEFLLAGAEGTLARSRNQGRDWRLAEALTKQEFETLQRLPDGVLIAAGGGGVIARSEDDGQHWALVRNGVNAYTHMIAANPNGILVAAGTQGSLARSEDGGQSWQPVRAEDDHYFFSVVFEARHHAFIAAGTRGLLMRSTDDGRSWTEIRLPGEGTVGPLFTLPQGRVLALSTDRGILGSDDGGQSWSPGDANPGVIWQSLANDPETGHIVAIGRDTLPHFSNDGGRHWQATASQDAKGAVRVKFIGGAFLAAGREGEILRSTDGGRHFERVFLPVFAELRDFEAMPGVSGGIVAVGNKGSILRSLDAGKSWKAVSSGSQDILRSIVSEPSRGTLLVAGRSGPVLRSDDAGLSWRPATDMLDARISGGLASGREVLFWGDRIIRLSE